MMPCVVLALGLIFRLPFGRAFRAGLTVGFGFVGIGLIINLIFGNMGPVMESLIRDTGLRLAALEVGWPAAAAVAFGTRVGALIFAVGILTNLAMVLLRLTRTLNVDIWNYWHWSLSGSLVMVVTGSLWFGLLAAVAHAVFTLKMADYTAPRIQAFFGTPGITISQGFAMANMPIIMPVVWLVDRIPGIDRISADPVAIQKRLGFLGQPAVLATGLTVIAGLVARQPAGTALRLGVAMGAVFLLLPRVVAILMEGMTPFAEAAGEFMRKRAGDRPVHIGMDCAIGVGHPTNMAAALLMVPISLLLAAILPGNRLLPFGDLAGTAYFSVMITPWTRGNLVKTMIVGIVLKATVMYMGSDWAPLFTRAADAAGFPLPEGAALVTVFGNPFAWVCVRLTQLFF